MRRNGVTSEQWQVVKELFAAALEHRQADRSAFLAEACAGDLEIQHEVESLLEAHERDAGFMNQPVGKLLPEDQPMLSSGQCLGHYEVIKPLGKGGMGQVYLALDIQLRRKVALKLLSSTCTNDVDRVKRFEQEAQAASALNHPNIVTIHEIGQTESLRFISTEFIDGETLREHMKNTRLPLSKVLDIATQVASALHAAHEAGIVHRDIKPENLMMRRDGIVKVLDFGIAKLGSQQVATTRPLTTVSSIVDTTAGIVMGTIGYMSPEQATGEEVDARTDIWSLGVVLYEMLAGQPPFAATTARRLIASMSEDQPPPLATIDGLPAELERITRKALSKGLAQRYQTANEMAEDLKNLKEELEVEARLKRTLSSSAGVNATGAVPALTMRNLPASTGELAFTPRRTQLTNLVSRFKTTRSVVALLLLLFTAVAGWAYLSAKVRRTPSITAPKPPAKHGTSNEEAYRLYLHGMYLVNNRNLDDARKSVETLEQAVALDPGYARAWAGLAYAHRTVSLYSDSLSTHETYQRAIQAINKALALDPNLSEAHSALCENKYLYEWDFRGAEQECNRAIQLDPDSALGHEIYSRYLMGRGRHDEAIAEIKAAIDLEPASRFNQRNYGRALFYARRFAEAEEQFKRVAAMDPNFVVTYTWLVHTLKLQGKDAEAFDWFRRLLALRKVDRETVQIFERSFNITGWNGVRRAWLKHLDEVGRDNLNTASLYAELGDKNKAFEYLETIYQRREIWMTYLGVDPRLDLLRDDPRFEELLSRIEGK